MREPKKETIDGIQYSVTPMAPMMATKTLTKLVKIAGEPLGKLIDAKPEGKSVLDQNIDGALIGQAIKALTDNMDEGQVEKIITTLLNPNLITYCAELDEKFLKLESIDSHFSQHGNLGTMFKLLKFVLEVNYSDFLKDLVG